MPEYQKVQDLYEQIKGLSEAELKELATQLDLDINVLIRLLPTPRKINLFRHLYLYWPASHYQIEDDEDLNQQDNEKMEDYKIHFWQSKINKDLEELKIESIEANLISCNIYTIKDTGEKTVTVELRYFPFYTPRIISIPIPKIASDVFISNFSDYLTSLVREESHRALASISERIFNRLQTTYPENFEIELPSLFGDLKTIIEPKRNIKKNLYMPYEKHNLTMFAYYKADYEKTLKELKTNFRQIYNALDHRLPIKTRENRARKILLEILLEKDNVSLRKEIANNIGLSLKPAETAIVLAAKDCGLNPFSKNGKISSQIRKALKEGQKLRQEMISRKDNNNT